jgi:hypothetical protein
LWAGERRWLVALLGILAVLGAAHAHVAQEALAAHGREPAFGASRLSLDYVLSAVSPSDRPVGWAVGLAAEVLGIIGLIRLRHSGGAAPLILTAAAVLIPATVFLGREYWGLTFGVALASYAPAALPLVRTSP